MAELQDGSDKVGGLHTTLHHGASLSSGLLQQSEWRRWENVGEALLFPRTRSGPVMIDCWTLLWQPVEPVTGPGQAGRPPEMPLPADLARAMEATEYAWAWQIPRPP